MRPQDLAFTLDVVGDGPTCLACRNALAGQIPSSPPCASTVALASEQALRCRCWPASEVLPCCRSHFRGPCRWCCVEAMARASFPWPSRLEGITDPV
jgi:hypothetical protein